MARSDNSRFLMAARDLGKAIEGLTVLIADGNSYMRRLTRTMLTNLGVRSIYEATDGLAAIEAIRNLNPDVMMLDWAMPIFDGCEVMRIVRSPGDFPNANLPVIMMTDVGLRSRVNEAIRVGAHELLVKPISPKMLQQRLLGFIFNARPMVRAGTLYIPMPRRPIDLNGYIQAEAAAAAS